MTGCGCVILVASLVALLFFLLFGSTDPGEPIEQFASLAAVVLLGRMARVPVRLALVRARRA